MSITCCSAPSASGARPRLVCRMTPVALITGRREYLSESLSCCSIVSGPCAMAPASSPSSSEPAAIRPAQIVDEFSRSLDRGRVTEAVRHVLHCGDAQQFVDGRKLAKEIRLGRHGWISVLCVRTVSSFNSFRVSSFEFQDLGVILSEARRQPSAAEGPLQLRPPPFTP